MKKILLMLVLVLAAAVGYLLVTGQTISLPFLQQKEHFLGFQTDATKTTVDLAQITSEGTGKSGIPSLTNPQFTSIIDTKIPEATEGIAVESGGERKFYPLSILSWHEIINDRLDGKDIVVIYCNYCKTAVVFDRLVGWDTLEFRSSGYNYNGISLMYDLGTESFWSQQTGEALVGTYHGSRLTVIPSTHLTLKEAASQYDNLQVAAFDTYTMEHEQTSSPTPEK